jgi:hypothetical protein
MKIQITQSLKKKAEEALRQVLYNGQSQGLIIPTDNEKKAFFNGFFSGVIAERQEQIERQKAGIEKSD